MIKDTTITIRNMTENKKMIRREENILQNVIIQNLVIEVPDHVLDRNLLLIYKRILINLMIEKESMIDLKSDMKIPE